MEFEKDIESVLQQLKKVNNNLYEYWSDELYFSGTGWDNWNQSNLNRMRQDLHSFQVLFSI
jgi:hypothetical protein